MIIRRLIWTVVGVTGLLSAELRAEASLTDLEGLVKTWTALRQEIASEKREWQTQQAFLNREIDLLNKEIAGLEAEIAAFTAESSSEDRKRQAQLFRKQELTEGIEAYVPMLDRVSAGIRALQSGLPASLASQVSFPEKTRVVDRVQAVAGALGALESLFGGMQVVKELREDENRTAREISVLYLGQARAFAVSANGDWAAVGTPGEQGWQWTPAPGSAGEIRTALSVYEQSQPAVLVTLPLQILLTNEVTP